MSVEQIFIHATFTRRLTDKKQLIFTPKDGVPAVIVLENHEVINVCGWRNMFSDIILAHGEVYECWHNWILSVSVFS